MSSSASLPCRCSIDRPRADGCLLLSARTASTRASSGGSAQRGATARMCPSTHAEWPSLTRSGSSSRSSARAANSRIVSNIQYRVSRRVGAMAEEALVEQRLRRARGQRRRTSSAASSVRPPAKTGERRGTARCSSGASRWYDPRSSPRACGWRSSTSRSRVASRLMRSVRPFEDRLGRQRPDPRGGELDREREPVERATELGDVLVRREVRSNLRRPCDEERLGVRGVQRLDCDDALRPQAEPLPARARDDQLVAALTRVDTMADAAVEKVLDVVEEKECATSPERAREGPRAAGRRGARRSRAPGRATTADQRRLAQGREGDPEEAIGEVDGRYSRLPASASRVLPVPPGPVRVSKRVAVVEQLDDRSQFVTAADERRCRNRKVRPVPSLGGGSSPLRAGTAAPARGDL